MFEGLYFDLEVCGLFREHSFDDFGVVCYEIDVSLQSYK